MESRRPSDRLLPLLCLVSCLLVLPSSVARGDSRELPSDHWVIQPGLSAHELFVRRGAELVSTDALSWSDGRSALVLYIRADEFYFRCVDFRTASFGPNGFPCFQLVGPRR